MGNRELASKLQVLETPLGSLFFAPGTLMGTINVDTLKDSLLAIRYPNSKVKVLRSNNIFPYSTDEEVRLAIIDDCNNPSTEEKALAILNRIESLEIPLYVKLYLSAALVTILSGKTLALRIAKDNIKAGGIKCGVGILNNLQELVEVYSQNKKNEEVGKMTKFLTEELGFVEVRVGDGNN